MVKHSMLIFAQLAFGICAFAFGAETAASQEIEKTIVYIECTPADGGSPSRGTGVVVNPKGFVLTARHVVPDGSSCKGSLGVADSNTAQRLIFQEYHPTANFDAALLRFSDQREYEYAPYCELEDWMIRKKIFVAGYPGKTQTGVPSYREGVLSTVVPNSRGILETDGQTVAGMSGGPVYSNNLVGLVGLVIGADFAADGTVSYYGILPLARVASYFTDLIKSDKPCYHEFREVDFSDPETGEENSSWEAGDGPLSLNVGAEEGFCFLTEVYGEFNDPEDTVFVSIADDMWQVEGVNRSGGIHGAKAGCVWYE